MQSAAGRSASVSSLHPVLPPTPQGRLSPGLRQCNATVLPLNPRLNFYILKHTKCPAVLTENFFMDNVDDVRFLESREGKNALTLLHIEGIREYFNRYAEKLFLT